MVSGSIAKFVTQRCSFPGGKFIIFISTRINMGHNGYYNVIVGFDMDSLKDPLVRDNAVITININNWEVIEKVTGLSAIDEISFDKCSFLGGIVVDNCNLEEGNHKVIGLIKDLGKECCVNITQEPFCGISTNSPCKANSDCKTGGCSGQVCESIYANDKIQTIILCSRKR